VIFNLEATLAKFIDYIRLHGPSLVAQSVQFSKNRSQGKAEYGAIL